MSAAPQPRAGTRERGFTLIEAMVALVVLAVGMLGIAGLYVTTLRSGGGAIYRMQAVNLAADLADRIRANPTGGAAYAGAGANNNCYGGAVDCAPGALAANDILVWQAQLAVLPGGAGAVVFTPGVAPLLPTYTITVSWTEQGAPGGVAQSYVMNMQI